MPEAEVERLSEMKSVPRATATGGVWSLDDDGLTLVDADWAGRAVVLAPTEQVLMLAVDLPIANRAQRQSALAFAIEDQVSEPIEAVHAALGEALSPGRYLAGVVRHDRMRLWCTLIDAAGLKGAALVPDALTLPSPGPGYWSVALRGERALVRAADGPGFAVPAANLALMWEAAGRPLMASYGDALPDELVGEAPGPGWTPRAMETPPVLDLRQGPYAVRATSSPLTRRLAMVLGLGLLAHVAIHVVDTVALMRAADAKKAEVALLVGQAGGVTTGDLATTARSMLPQTPGARTDFLPLFSRTATALQPVGPTASLQTVTYGDDAGLTLAVQAPDLAGLQAVEAALKAAGLDPTSGASSVDAGRASQEIVLGRSAGRAG